MAGTSLKNTIKPSILAKTQNPKPCPVLSSSNSPLFFSHKIITSVEATFALHTSFNFEKFRGLEERNIQTLKE